jgi:hypothetical protein
MDINHIQLNPAALAGLYKNHLVETGDASPAPAKTTGSAEIPAAPVILLAKETSSTNTAPVKFLGSNERKVLLLVNHPDVVFLPDEELKFLTGILAACKLSLADVALVNLGMNPGTGYKELLSQFGSNKVLLFGSEPASISLPLAFPAFQLQAFNGTTYHWCPDLHQMENDRALKTQLWTNLKKLFTI